MIALFTDFGWQGPYVGEMKAVVAALAPDVPVIDLMHDAPAFRPDLAGPLLAALTARLPEDAVVVAVVDPGVGSERAPLVVEVAGRRLVGPDNGLFATALARAGGGTVQRIAWVPERLSASFHGRDLFAPVAARLAGGQPVALEPARPVVGEPADPWQIVYVDAFGNAMTGVPADTVPADAVLTAAGRALRGARTFAEVPAGQAFWYANSLDLVELAVNRGSAAEQLGLAPGTPVTCAEKSR